MLKQVSLAAALAATFITGSAAVAYADGDAGLNEAAAAWTTSAALERGANEGAFAPWRSYGYASYGYVPYGYASEPMRVRSSRMYIRRAR